jgi:hypothetical protein
VHEPGGPFESLPQASDAIAGMTGALVMLRWSDPMRRIEAVLSVLSGAAVAWYIAPAAAFELGLSRRTEDAAAFLLGLLVLHIVPGLFRYADAFIDGRVRGVQRREGERDRGD